MPDTFIKDPNAVLDYKFDWAALTNNAEGATADWLESGETISSFVITATDITLGDGVTAVDTVTPPAPIKTNNDTSITVWGFSPIDGAIIACKVRTSAGRIDERTITISVIEQ